MTWKKLALISTSILALTCASSGNVRAGSNLVTNGDFESATFSTGSASTELGNPSGWSPTGSLTGWTNGGNANGGVTYNLWWNASTATTTNAYTQYPTEDQKLDAAFMPLSTGGDHFVGLDGDSTANGPLSQSITGLTVGQLYGLTFDSAAIQLSNRTGATTEKLQVSLGGDSQTLVITDAANPLPSQGFSGWAETTFFFTATSATEVLSFLSIGTPNGLPPMVLLDNVSMQAVPEPAAFIMMGIGAIALVGVRLRRRGNASNSAI
jgi:hypothetical protein